MRDGQKLGSTGMLNTVWNDDGEGIFDENWFGVLFGAAAGWQPGESSEDRFHCILTGWHFTAMLQARSARRSKRVDGRACCAERRPASKMRRTAISGSIRFHRAGQQIAAKICPWLATCVSHAERAITLLAAARARHGEARTANPEALDALELGARRIDFVGLKFQNADECVSLYNQALAMAGGQEPVG